MSRGQLFWGGMLILLGGLMLAGQMGFELPNGNSLMSLFFPVALIGSGIWVLLSVFIRREVTSESASIQLQGASEASLKINHGAGEFRLHSGASADEFMRGTFTGGLEHKAERSGDRLQVRMRPAGDFFMPSFGRSEGLNWDVSLNASIPTALDMNMGANKSVINLQDMNITALKLNSGASDTTITLPAQGRLNVTCEVGAASLTLIVPEGVAIRTHATMGAGDFHVDKSRFPASESPDFASAPNAVDIRVTGGAASVRVR
ncbi:hypothetical protein MASR2M66_16790 [Chloroflexota bacterium]